MERRGNSRRPPTPDHAAAAGRSTTFPAAGDAGHANLTSSSGSSASSTVTGEPLDFLGQIYAACKRQRPLGTTKHRAARILLPQGEGTAKAGISPSVRQNSEGMAMQKQRGVLAASRLQKVSPDQKNVNADAGVLTSNQNDMLTTPSVLSTITDTHNQNAGQNDQQKSGMDLFVDRNKSSLDVSSSQMTSQNASAAVGFKKGQFYSVGDSHLTSQGDNYHVAEAAHDQIGKHQKLELAGAAIEIDIKYHAENLPQKGVEEAGNQNHGEQITRCSVVGSSVTAVSLHSGQNTRVPQSNQYASPMEMPECTVESAAAVPGSVLPKQQEAATPSSAGGWNPKNQQVPNTTDKAAPGNGGFPSQGQGLSANEQSTSAKDGGTSEANRDQKERRKKGYDPEHFFKVNGKLYQKLGKIGSGGSSEVHKVISAERAIYALKKIKLKGRDYPTAYGFCQEIGYLNKLKGKSNIIQLIDYEVTDKNLLKEGSPRDGKIKDDQYIYMVLEFGEIDLAHMVDHKWKERNNSNMKIDENWLRFYWQQMLEAVNTIHEERIVHSDLKPANFMLVRGSLKLIDFGIAKAIMNDTTNIQRDAKVGTLNYMSPEALLCDEQDSSGNVFKCGRPTDIWSLGCILYLMVYGKTPFADYTNFWTKFKAVTDRNHKISYPPVDNPWLIDLMRRCLAWDRDERWRIPQLLQHPFLVPRVPRDLPPINPDPDPCTMMMEQIRPYWADPEVARLFSEIRDVIAKRKEDETSQSTKM
ncbi:Serine/threonine-protein kinase mph1 [Hordeum vulgare]|uniref:serine/threonine-protein kinase MPS1 isoform X3 n=1 Tax=Hordeum vulgare subsp. vulgare TaxID=112509 RepID=UPI00029627AA|nr:serine/threonine-protein kinase MPS1 isoform X3 [Hordeum vulgare subsp. vulgare]KAE8820118.1 Serine/threonine-protein kinase mph1 [Hordeum vulgare]